MARLKTYGSAMLWLALFVAVGAGAWVIGREAGLSARPEPRPEPVYTSTGLPAAGDTLRSRSGFTGFEAEGIGEGQPVLFGRVSSVEEAVVLWVPDEPEIPAEEEEVLVLTIETSSGPITVEVKDGSRLRTLRPGTAGEILPGSRLAIVGTVSDGAVDADSLLVLLPDAQVQPQARPPAAPAAPGAQ